MSLQEKLFLLHYLKNQNFKIKLKVQNPHDFKLFLDYEYYHFNFNMILKFLVQNDFKELNLQADNLIKETQNIDELIMYK